MADTTMLLEVPLKDEPGELGRVARTMAKVDVNVEAFSVDAGMGRFLTSDPRAADEALRLAGYKPRFLEGFQLVLQDQPGHLAELAERLGREGVNVQSVFGMADGTRGTLFLVVDNMEAAAPIVDELGTGIASPQTR